jgi:hypothetical protein
VRGGIISVRSLRHVGWGVVASANSGGNKYAAKLGRLGGKKGNEFVENLLEVDKEY